MEIGWGGMETALAAAELHLQNLSTTLKGDDLLMDRSLLTLKGGQRLLEADVLGFLKRGLNLKFFFHATNVCGEVLAHISQLRGEAVTGPGISALDAFLKYDFGCKKRF